MIPTWCVPLIVVSAACNMLWLTLEVVRWRQARGLRKARAAYEAALKTAMLKSAGTVFERR